MLRIVLILVLVAVLALAGWFFLARDNSAEPVVEATGTVAVMATPTVDPVVGAVLQFRPPGAPPATQQRGTTGIIGSGPSGPVMTPAADRTVAAYYTQASYKIATLMAMVSTRQAGAAPTVKPRAGSASRSGSASRASTTPRDVWLGTYYSGVKTSGTAVMVRRDGVIDMNWGGGAPAPGLPADGFAIKWQRLFTGDGGMYRLRAVTDDGFQVKLDGKVILNSWTEGAKDQSVDFGMAKRDHEIQIEYFENRGDARAKVWIERPSDPKFAEWKAEYYNNTSDLSGSPALTRNEKAPKITFGTKGPDPAINPGWFSARFTREIDFDKGTYEFQAKADDGVRVWVDGDLLINEWHGSDGKTVYEEIQTLNGEKDVRVEYYNSFDKGSLTVTWKKLTTDGDDATPRGTATLVLPTLTPTTISSPTVTRTPSRTAGPPSPSPSPTPVPSATDTEVPTAVPTDTETPMPTETETPTPTP